MSKYRFETLQLHVGQEHPDPATDSRAVPIYQTTSYVFRNSQHAADRFGLADAGNIYGRLTNSTQDVFEKRIAALEGGSAALALASGAAAIAYTIEALPANGGHIVAQKTIYGGSYNLLAHTLTQYGITTTFVDAHNLEEVKAAILKAADILKEKGAVVENFDLGLVDYAIPAYYVIASAEASSNLSRFDGVKYGYRTKEYEGLHNMYKKTRSEGFGPEVKRRIMLGSFVLSSGYYDAYYLKALRTKALIKKEFDKAFAKYDLILAPASPDTAPLLGSSLSDPLKMYLGDIYTISVNLAGLPGMTVPCGLDSKGLPIGMQLIGDCFKEKDIIRAGYAFECTRKYEMPELAKVSD